jgi:putative redox protein
MTEVIVRSVEGLTHTIETRGHRIVVDEPSDAGGQDAGPTPYELLLGALGACTAITVRLYAGRKSWPLEAAEVHLSHERVHARDCEDCDNPQGSAFLDRITKRLVLQGPLSDEQRARLLEVAERCPVQRTLLQSVVVRTESAAAGAPTEIAP